MSTTSNLSTVVREPALEENIICRSVFDSYYSIKDAWYHPSDASSAMYETMSSQCLHEPQFACESMLYHYWCYSATLKNTTQPCQLIPPANTSGPVWYCCQCNHGAFSVAVNTHCPNCHAQRCGRCRVKSGARPRA